MQLAEKGLYRAAFSSALYAKNDAEMRDFIAFFNAKTGGSWTDASQLSRLFGVSLDDISRTLVL